jgi:rare lipoprotein A
VKTASGEVYDLYNMTAAHATLPLHTRVRVKSLRTGKTVIVTINDRLSDNRGLIKLSYYTARRLGLLNTSAPEVEVRGLKNR